MDNTVVVNQGRALEVREYGDRRGHPAFFFHGLIGSHYQASYVAEQAGRAGLRIIAPNRPGVGRSDFVERKSPLEAVSDVEHLAKALGVQEFSVIGISGGAPYALAVLYRLGERVRTTTIISGMGPPQLPGALHGMDQRRRIILAAGSRYPGLARKAFRIAARRFHAHPEPFLKRLVKTWSPPDQELFRKREVFDLFLKDIEQVFVNPSGPEGLAQELSLYRSFGFALGDLPASRRVMIWHGLTDNIVPPAMAWKMVQAVPNAEAHLLPGGHFMAIDDAGLIIARLAQQLDS
jgi:pimeloyl-ACP methyl ester carboxylesterase